MKKIVIILTFIFIITIISIFLFTKKPLKIYFFDVEKSDSILITYKDKNILIDTSLEEYSDKIIKYLKDKNIKTIDYLIITHFDKDHVGGASLIIDNFEIKNIIQSNYIKQSEYYNKYMESIIKKDIVPIVINNEYSFELEELNFKIYGSNIIYEDDTSNNSSLVLSLNYKNNNFLFTGDIEKDRIKDMNFSNYDLVKLPHHGNYNKQYERLLDMTKPKYVVITNNIKDNKTIDLLNKKNIKYYLTDNLVTVSSDGNNIIIH